MRGDLARSGAPSVDAQAGQATDNVLDQTVPSQNQATQSVGLRLRGAREAKGLSESDVSNALKLSPRQVAALEADDWPNLPCNTILRGFVRNYARLVDLDSDQLMAALDVAVQMPKLPELQMSVGTPVSFPQEGKADRRDYVRAFSGVLVLVLAISAYFLVPQELWRATLAAIKATGQSREVVAEKPAEPVKEESKAPDEPVAAPPAAVVQQEVATPTPPPPLPSANKVLKFSFTRPAWVEVRDRSGQIIFSQLSQAGSQREIEGQPPFSLVIGNASHVSLQYNGKAVDLSRRSKEDVARVSVE